MVGIRRTLVAVNRLNRHLKRMESVPEINSEARKAIRISNELEAQIKRLYNVIHELRNEVEDGKKKTTA
jgi:hypothetical protein